ncbi:MAG: DNA polymerase III subunit alpha [Candidatus Eremiobacteraeota bacterium]|nr:DNA polymerase III subunit alpha [Candidatus Eremiobacteraeota bacterium]
MREPAYAELHCWSNFSFLEGSSHPEEVVVHALRLGLAGVALTDRDGLYGAVRFAKAALGTPLAALCGAELTLESTDAEPIRPGRPARPQKEVPTDSPRLVLIAADRAGYANLAHLISIAQLRGRKRDARLRLADLDGRTAGLVALSGGRNGIVEKALLRRDAEAAVALGARLRDLFPSRFYLELQHHVRPEDPALIRALVRLASQLDVPYVATNGVGYVDRDDGLLCDVLTCVKYATSLQQAGTLLRPNHEHHLKTPAQMARLFAEFPRALSATLEIVERCAFRLDTLRGEFPLFPIPTGETSPQSYLRTLVYRGARERYRWPLEPKVERQLEYELGIIARMDLAGYFLVVWDIANAAKRLGVLAQGRGSAANSAVCYALGITAVDPIAGELLFERFLSEERGEVPDIDIDFAHQDRERVIQYVYERYGREHAAMTAEVITYRTRSAIRDVGKALGLTLGQVDAIVREYDARESLAGALGAAPHEGASLPDSVTKRRDLDAASNVRRSREDEPSKPPRRLQGFSPKDAGATDPDAHLRGPVGGKLGTLLLKICRRIDGFPRHMGIHSGGMVITRSPLVEVAPVEWASMRDRTIVQWDKDDLSDLGLIKIDLLGLGMLSLLRDAFALYRRRYPGRAPLALEAIPPDDRPTYEMLQRADSIGVFQVESRAQQSMLPRLRPHCFYDLVMQVAIIRPGPIQGDMIHPFLRRRNGIEPVTYPHPKLRPILERTLGVPLFQEQGMRMAMEAAGFSAGEADRLRRAMGHKRSHERMAEIYPRLIEGMVANGIAREDADRLFHMLEGFADYGFPESHAASFALLAYASAYVKCHEPAIFCAAILNVQPMGFYSTEVLVNDARRHDVVVRAVAVNESEWWSFVDAEGALRLGFHLVRGLGDVQRERLERALAAGGEFGDLLDFARRTQLERDALENLAAAGAFAPWYATRREAMWALRGLDEREARGELGRAMEIDEPQPALAPLTAIERTTLDIDATGVSDVQPIVHVRPYLDAHNVLAASRLPAMPQNLVCKIGGLVITRQRPGTAKGFVFLTIEDETGLVNVIVRPDVYERNRRTIRSAQSLIVEGVLQKEQGCIDVIMKRCWPLDTHGAADKVRARNFH